ncbi:nucleoside-diphosphate sugar epimerase [Saccharothrix sp. ALI-22-I]|uniref:NAD-dependent epimerase/dehydratase family protein n=1 Tax=Saccharothrix sp. ALI-22-I TaxID=1933778 RepID=UPI00097BF9D4|nr:NAD-dependent epimerase/dehydratase family protein [Saccharothrix sp. ALI-22-I]ONI90013.1 nucleoside-diphosphate sugar epimerase [Saccharothrix sp. ALI-22-I]
MKVLVVGASGLVGQQVVGRLRERGHEVTSVARTARDGVDHAVDATTATDAEFRSLLAGHDGVVFAAGADGREVPRKPAYPVFHHGNVAPVVRLLTAAREAGLSRAVVLGSYYTHFHRLHPEWRLAERHPYIRSRVEQARAGRAAAGPDLPVAVLELPFVLGRSGDRLPNWSGGLDKWVRSRSPLVAPPGGSAVTTAAHVAEAAVDALERASGEDIPMADENLTWPDMIGRIATAAGHPRAVRRLPGAVVRVALLATGLVQRVRGLQSGVDPMHLDDLLLRELFVTPARPMSLDAAVAETFPRS